MDDEAPYVANMKKSLTQHAEWLAAFTYVVWPLYKEHGFTIGEAVLCYKMNAFNNDVWDLMQPPKEDWKDA